MNDDLIRRETLIRALDKSISGMREVAAGNGVMTKAINLVQIARDFADNLPAVDAVEVVRCKDCKHYKTQNKSARWNHETLYCMRSAAVKMKPDDFCSYGVRRE